MIPSKSFTQKENQAHWTGVLVNLGLFLLALAPRAYDLVRFVTADEAKWIYRSAQFLAAFLQGDLAGTSVNLTPAVTTTWLGSLGLWLYYQLNSGTIGQPLVPWLVSLPEFQPDLSILAATRWAMAFFTSLGVVLIYRTARPLLGPGIAFLGAGLIALDPHLVALSRILGHDAPTALFMTLSLLLFIKVLLSGQPEVEASGLIVSSLLSGAMAGLAFLSKAPALFLVPFIGLLGISRIWTAPRSWPFWGKHLLLWGLAAYLAFIVCWPAAWIDPIGRPAAVVQNAFLSATDTEEAGEEGYWRVPELGPFYYLVNGAFKLSPLVMVGLGLALGLAWPRLSGKDVQRREWSAAEKTVGWLFLFILLFTLFMTWGEKRSARYLLPVFPAAALIAAYGWSGLYQKVLSAVDQSMVTKDGPKLFNWLASARVFPAILLGCACLILLPYTPYYFTYFNPLLGGSLTAPYLVKIGWGEGLDRVGRFLQRELTGSRVGTAYASTVSPYFKGDLADVEADQLDYIVLYLKQIQGGDPSPAFIRYFEQTPPIFSVDLNGIDYAKVYAGPALRPAISIIDGTSPEGVLRPTHFRPLTSIGQRGETLDVDVLWQAGVEPASEPVTLTLQPLLLFEGFTTTAEGKPTIEVGSSILAENTAPLLRQPGAEGLIISRHTLLLPEDPEQVQYALVANGYALGGIDVRNFRVPAEMAELENMSFNGQIALRGYRFEPTPDYIGVTLAWQAQSSDLPNYTVFVQLLEAETNERLAGVDLQPLQGRWPTGRWVKGEVVVDEMLVAVPPGLKPGFYKVIVGLYRPETGERLTLPDGQDYWLVPWTFIRKE